jgi:hypothetical protein
MRKLVIRNTALAIAVGIMFGVCSTAYASPATNAVSGMVESAIAVKGVTRALFIAASKRNGYTCNGAAQVFCSSDDGDGTVILGRFIRGEGLVHHGYGFTKITPEVCTYLIRESLGELYGEPTTDSDGTPHWSVQGSIVSFSASPCLLSIVH